MNFEVNDKFMLKVKNMKNDTDKNDDTVMKFYFI
jgi:hypothetical protein